MVKATYILSYHTKLEPPTKSLTRETQTLLIFAMQSPQKSLHIWVSCGEFPIHHVNANHLFEVFACKCSSKMLMAVTNRCYNELCDMGWIGHKLHFFGHLDFNRNWCLKKATATGIGIFVFLDYCVLVKSVPVTGIHGHSRLGALNVCLSMSWLFLSHYSWALNKL